ncbi:MAG: 30S ribosome-binding factor RbfA [Pseudomonadota bacterium]|nr:30S ribosome-binding factor RbfA [Pseudomonadota bacterium]
MSKAAGASPPGARSARIADQIQRSLAEVIRLELRDPRVGLITLTGVELSRDQSHAKVFFTVLGSASDVAHALEGLGRASGFLRSELAHRLTTRKVPELHFAYDESVERGMRLSQLIDAALKPPAAPAKRKPRGGSRG